MPDGISLTDGQMVAIVIIGILIVLAAGILIILIDRHHWDKNT